MFKLKPKCLISNETNPLKHSLWLKSYDQNSEQKSFSSIVFKLVWSTFELLLLSNYQDNFDYPLLTYQAHHWGWGIKVINQYKMRCLQWVINNSS